MKVPSTLASAFGAPFEEQVARFALEKGLLPDAASLGSERFIARSVVPHVKKLSSLFNRIDPMEGRPAAQEKGLAPYWKDSSNPEHLRLAYFLYFMPPNLFRVASVWAELARLGYRWAGGETLKAIELGAGPASGACGIAAAEKHSPAGLPSDGSWAFIEQDKAMLQLGVDWAADYFSGLGLSEWGTRPFHRKLGINDLLPRGAPRFNLWVMSYFLNELSESPREIAQALTRTWERHLEREGIAILVEPALKLQSRKLLEIRRELIGLWEGGKSSEFQVLLPCMGHQACGALAEPEDWCHEEVLWWRPPYFRAIDRMAGLDRKSLPFSYLVVARSTRALEELLPGLAGGRSRHRLVSPAHAEGKELEFFLCGQEGKRRARYRPEESERKSEESWLQRGDILLDAALRGDARATRVESARRA